MMRYLTMLTVLGALLLAAAPAPFHLNAYAEEIVKESDLVPSESESEGETKTKQSDGTIVNCEDLPEVKGGALIGKIVPCLVYTIQGATINFTAQMVAFLSPLLYAFLALVVVLFGLRVVQREPEIHKQGFLLLVKIAIVTTILADLGGTSAYDGSYGSGKLIPAMYGIMSESQEIVAGAINGTTLTCDVAKYKGPETPEVWAIMDCVMGKLYGFTMSGGSGKPSMLLATSVVGLLTGFLYGGAWGVTVFFGMLALLFSIFMLVIRTVVGFLSAYLVICLMLIMTPLLLPLAFLKGTMAYFDQTWRIILASILTPVIITAYSMFALIVYDRMLFADDSILQKLFKYENIEKALQPPKKPCNKEYTGNPYEVRLDTAKPTDAEKNKLISFPNMQNIGTDTLTGSNDLCGWLKTDSFVMQNMKDWKEGDLQKMFMDLVQLAILAYLIHEGQKALPSIITQLLGRRSALSVSQAVIDGNLQVMQGFQNAKASAMAQFRNDPKNEKSGFKSGGNYLKDLPRDFANASNASRKAFTDGMKDKE